MPLYKVVVYKQTTTTQFYEVIALNEDQALDEAYHCAYNEKLIDGVRLLSESAPHVWDVEAGECEEQV